MSKKDFQNGFALGFASGGVVEVEKEEQEKSVNITENGTTEVTPDKGMALSKVTVNVAVESGGTEKSIVTVTTSANNTVAVCDVFRTFIDNDKDIVAFRLLRGKETWAKNQSLFASLTKSNNIAHLRWSGNTFQNYLGSNYDAVLSVGDEFEMIKIGELWDGV